MVYFLAFLLFLTLIALGVSIYYLVRFARIIMILEDDFSESVQDLRDCEATIGNLLSMQMFFDSKEVKLAVMDALEGVKAARMSVMKMVRKFTERSKQKYIKVLPTAEEKEIEEDEDQWS